MKITKKRFQKIERYFPVQRGNETFRHGIWYAKGDVKQRLDIVPLTLAQFQKHVVAMFTSNTAHPDQWRDLILQCETERDNLDAPDWMRYIAVIVDQRIRNFC